MDSTKWLSLGMLVFVWGGKPKCRELNPRSRAENQQQTKPTYAVKTGNKIRATLVEVECSYHDCAIPFFVREAAESIQEFLG